jgi:hypothetical protein
MSENGKTNDCLERFGAKLDTSGNARQLQDGSIVLPRFAIVDECRFFNKKKNEWVDLTPERLQKIADRINQRATETGTFTPIIPGHTQDDLPEERQPRVIGYGFQAKVEPFLNPRTLEPTGRKAVYVTPIANPGEVHLFKKLNSGRSVELWLDPDDVYPIALLGANAPRRDLGPHLFSRHDGRDGDSHILFIQDEGDQMPEPDKKPVPDLGGKPDDKSDDALIEKILNKFLQSDLGKRLEALATAMEASSSAPPGAGDPAGPGGMPPSPMPPQGGPGGPGGQGGDLLGPEDYDDIFAPAPGAGAGGNAGMPNHDDKNKPTQLSASAFGPTNGFIPQAAEHMDMASGEIERIRFARLEQENADKDRRIRALEQAALKNTVANELLVLEAEGVIFNFDMEKERCAKFSRGEERTAHYEHMRTFYKRKEDQLPNNGQIPVPGDAQSQIRFARPGVAESDRMTEDEATEIAEEVARRKFEQNENVTVESVRLERRERAKGAAGNGSVRVQ